MEEHEKRQLIEQYIGACNRLDVDGMMAVLTHDVLFENGSAGETEASKRGTAEFRELAQQRTALFSDRTQNIHGGGNDRLPRQARLDMPDGPEAGSVIELSGESAFWFANGWINPLVDRSGATRRGQSLCQCPGLRPAMCRK